VASQLVVRTVESFLAETHGADIDYAWPLPYDSTLSIEANRLRMALWLANRMLASSMARDESLRGMATTAVAVLVSEARGIVAHVGDSRAYVWREGALRQLTADHSWVGEQMRAGVMSEAEAQRHPWRNVVTRALTGGPDPEVDLSDLVPQAGDRVLLCSDGLSGVVAAETMERIVGAEEAPDEACQRLIDAANEAGGPDNITVAILSVHVA
jgi:PPM family protein phosphatase